jgi:hypothetical protein
MRSKSISEQRKRKKKVIDHRAVHCQNCSSSAVALIVWETVGAAGVRSVSYVSSFQYCQVSVAPSTVRKHNLPVTPQKSVIFRDKKRYFFYSVLRSLKKKSVHRSRQ